MTGGRGLRYDRPGTLRVGLLLVAFVAYQFWGTALYEEQAQSHLKSELAHQLHGKPPHHPRRTHR